MAKRKLCEEKLGYPEFLEEFDNSLGGYLDNDGNGALVDKREVFVGSYFKVPPEQILEATCDVYGFADFVALLSYCCTVNDKKKFIVFKLNKQVAKLLKELKEIDQDFIERLRSALIIAKECSQYRKLLQ